MSGSPKEKFTGLQQTLGDTSQYMHALTGPMLQIAQGGRVATAAWDGLKGIVRMHLLGPFTEVLPVSLGVIAAIKGIVKATGALEHGMESVAKFEIYTGQFIPLLKSAEAAKQRVESLVNFAKSSPFRMDDVVKASKNLEVLTRGAYSNEAALKAIADGSALAGVSMEELSVVWGRLYDGLASNRGVGDATARLQELGLMSGVTRNKIEMLQESGADVGSIFREAFGAAEGDLKKAAGATDVLQKSLTTLQTTLDDTIAGAQRAFAKGSEAAEKMKLGRQTRELEALTPAAEAAGEAYGFLPSVLEHIKKVISGVTIETKTFGQIARAVVQAVSVAVGGTLVLSFAHAAGKLLQLQAGFSNLAAGASKTSWGQAYGATIDAVTGKFAKLQQAAKINSVLKVTGAGNLTAAEARLKKNTWSAETQKMAADLGASSPASAAVRVAGMAARQRVDAVPASVSRRVLDGLGLSIEEKGSKRAVQAALLAQKKSDPGRLAGFMAEAGVNNVAELAYATSKYGRTAMPKIPKILSDEHVGRVLDITGAKDLAGAAAKLRTSPSARMVSELDAPSSIAAARRVSGMAGAQRVDAVPMDVSERVAKGLGLSGKEAGSKRSVQTALLKEQKADPGKVAGMMADAGVRNVAELSSAVSRYGAAADKAKINTGLFSKGLVGLVGGVRALAASVLATAAPMLALMAAMSLVTYVYDRFADVWKAKDEAKASAAATKKFADSIMEAGKSANTAADRLETYQKLLVEIKKNEEELIALRKTAGDFSPEVYETKVKSKKANIAQLNDTKGQLENLGGTSSMTVEELKQFKSRIALERELQQAAKERLNATLSGEQALVAAQKLSAEWAKKSLEADAERGAKAKLNNDPKYQSALNDLQIPAEDRQEAPMTDQERAYYERKRTEARAKMNAQPQESSGEIPVAQNVEHIRSQGFAENEQIEEILRKADNEKKHREAKALVSKMQTESGSQELALDAEIGKSNDKIQALTKAKAPQEEIEKEKRSKADMENRRTILIQESNPENVRKQYKEAKSQELERLGTKAQQTAAQQTSDIEEQRQRELLTAKDRYIAAPENKGKSAAQIDAGLRGGALVDEKAKIEQEAIAKKLKLMQEAAFNQNQVGEMQGRVAGMSQEEMETGTLSVRQNGKMVQKPLLSAEDKERSATYRSRLSQQPEYANNSALLNSEVSKFSQEMVATNLTGENQLNSGFGNKEQVAQGIAQLNTQSGDTEVKRKEEVQAAAVNRQGEEMDTRRLQMEQFIAALKSTSYQRAVDEGAARIKAAQQELNLAQEKAALKERGDEALAKEEALLKEQIAAGKDNATGALAKRLETVQSVRGTDVHTLDSNVRSGQADVDAGTVAQKEMMRARNLEVAQAVRSSQSQSLRTLESRAQTKEQRDVYRKYADQNDDRSTFDQAFEQGKQMFGGQGKSQEDIDKTAKEYASGITAKAQTEREIQRQSTPMVASDLARIGGASGEVAGGDVPRQQLDKLARIAVLMEQFVKQNSTQTEGDKAVNPMDY